MFERNRVKNIDQSPQLEVFPLSDLFESYVKSVHCNGVVCTLELNLEMRPLQLSLNPDFKKLPLNNLRESQ